MTATDAFAKHVFLGEIEYQAHLALRAAERLAITEHNFNSYEVWGAVQSILIAAGNVSKLLWPSRKKSAERGAMLRELLGVSTDNALADRSFRNHFEHYDERMEDWLSGRTSAGYVDQLIGSSVGFPNDFAKNVHRAYDYATKTLSYQGESLALIPVLMALDDLRVKCRATSVR